MAGSRRLTELVDSARSRLQPPPGPLTVALSGGADSAALAFLLGANRTAVSAVHVDHGLPGSPALRGAAAAIAEALGLELRIVEVEVAEGPSPEEQARKVRYEALDDLDRTVVTAHTRDDNAETVLINLIRGTGPTGLGGIPYHRPPSTYRPILGISRNETREIAALAGLPFRDDPMNADLGLTRNRIRHGILPLLRELNPQVVEAITRAASAVSADAAFLDSLAERIDVDPGVAVGTLITVPRPVADRVLARLLQQSGLDVSEDRLRRAWTVVQGRAGSQELAGGLSIVRREAIVVVE